MLPTEVTRFVLGITKYAVIAVRRLKSEVNLVSPVTIRRAQ